MALRFPKHINSKGKTTNVLPPPLPPRNVSPSFFGESNSHSNLTRGIMWVSQGHKKAKAIQLDSKNPAQRNNQIGNIMQNCSNFYQRLRFCIEELAFNRSVGEGFGMVVGEGVMKLVNATEGAFTPLYGCCTPIRLGRGGNGGI